MQSTARIAAFLAQLANNGDCPPTAGEIADALGIASSTVDGALRRMEEDGAVSRLGVAASGARTWMLTDRI